MNNHYVIRNLQNNEAWSNEFGWVENDTYDVFNQSDFETWDLPIDGYWFKL